MTTRNRLLPLLALGLAPLLSVAQAQAQTLAPPPAPTLQAQLLSQGRTDDAMRVLEAQVGANPFDPVAMNNLAAVKASRQDWTGAAELLVRANRIAPNNGLVRQNLEQLNDWLQRRASLVPADRAGGPEPTLLPEPPPLWGDAAASARAGQPEQPARR